MAVASGTTEVKTVLTIDTKQSATSMKELRAQIKQLKSDLVGLDKGTEEYNETLSTLGEKMGQLKDINEDTQAVSMQFDDSLKNTVSTIRGGIGAIQGMVSALSLLGIDMGEDNKLTQSLVKSMALLQGLDAFANSIKGAKLLITNIKTATAGAKSLGQALGMLAKSNPFGVLLTAATALLGVVSMLKNESKDIDVPVPNVAQEAGVTPRAFSKLPATEKEFLETMEEDLKQWENFITGGGFSKVVSSNERYLKAIGKTSKEIIKESKDWVNQQDESLNSVIKVYEKEIDVAKQYIKEIDAYYSKLDPITAAVARKADKEMSENYNRFKLIAETGEAALKRLRDLQGPLADEIKALDDEYKLQKIELLHQEQKEAAADAEKRRQEALQKKIKAEDEAHQHQLFQIELTYGQQQKLEDDRHEKAMANAKDEIEIEQEQARYAENTADIQNQMLEAENEELQKYWDTLKKRPDTAQSAFDALTKQMVANSNAIAENNKVKEEAIRLAAQERAETAQEKTELYLETEMLKEQTALLKERTAHRKSMAEAPGTKPSDYQDYELEYEGKELAMQKKYLDLRLANLRTYFQDGLITEEEYNKQEAELLYQQAELEAKIFDNTQERKKDALKKFMAFYNTYGNAISTIANGVAGVLNEAANQEGVSFENQKKLKIASTIITTLSAAMSSFASLAGIPTVGPALGAAAAATTIATGMLQVNKIRQTTKNSAATPTSAATAVQTPPQVVNLTGMSQDIQLPDQRVYVAIDDINEAQNRVEVVTNNSRI